MRKIFYCTALLLTLVVVGLGQSEKGSSKSVHLDSGTRIDGQLQSTVDVKKARVGDEVILKTTRSIKQNGKTIVPKGAKLLGRVTEVAQRSKQNSVSRLGMIFDRLQGGSLSTPINASIVSVTNTAANARILDDSADVFGSSSTTTSGSGSTQTRGGGLLGGVTNTVGGVVNTTTQTVGGATNSVVNTAGNTVGSTTGTLANGIQISNSTSASAQTGTTLSAANRNIRLEKGATIQLQLNSSVRSN